jgi:transcription elongation GreA/GreB family factor
MSVAFRRESDDEHKEPKFELPIPPGPNLVTRRGMAQIEGKVAALEALAEPSEDQQRDLRYWRQRLATARLAPSPPADGAALATRVTFRQAGALRTVSIVGEDEADPAAGLIAASAPLARALIGAGPGDRVDFGGRVEALELVAVEPIDG